MPPKKAAGGAKAGKSKGGDKNDDGSKGEKKGANSVKVDTYLFHNINIIIK